MNYCSATVIRRQCGACAREYYCHRKRERLEVRRESERNTLVESETSPQTHRESEIEISIGAFCALSLSLCLRNLCALLYTQSSRSVCLCVCLFHVNIPGGIEKERKDDLEDRDRERLQSSVDGASNQRFLKYAKTVKCSKDV